jgi:hypothetical protein
MSEFEQLKEELLPLMLEQSENLQKQTFLGINEQELRKHEKCFERIRELFADILEVLHDGLGYQRRSAFCLSALFISRAARSHPRRKNG